jgi:hypothetical protein
MSNYENFSGARQTGGKINSAPRHSVRRNTGRPETKLQFRNMVMTHEEQRRDKKTEESRQKYKEMEENDEEGKKELNRSRED